jgi:hypothetical protein
MEKDPLGYVKFMNELYDKGEATLIIIILNLPVQ